MQPPQQPLQRLPDWPERLAAYLAQHRLAPFAWGANDCARFAAGAVQAVTGRNLVQALHWHDAHSAALALAGLGGLQAAADQALPRLPIAATAWRGDIVMVRAPASPLRWLAVCDGALWWAPHRQGLARGPMRLATAAWGVGHA